MKKIYSLLFALITFSTLNAQNDLEVRSFISPQLNFNYDTTALVDIKIEMKNNGPSTLIAGDTIYITLRIATNDTTTFINYSKLLTVNVPNGSVTELLLEEDYHFDKSNDYSVCAGIDGTHQIPNNTRFQKSPTCVAFVVGVNEIKTKVEKLFYANNKINFRFNQKVNAQVHVYDISGKEIFSSRVNQKAGELDFAAPASGFYLLRLVEENGNTTTSKFIVSNK